MIGGSAHASGAAITAVAPTAKTVISNVRMEPPFVRA
jgi:hypothetical protein